MKENDITTIDCTDIAALAIKIIRKIGFTDNRDSELTGQPHQQLRNALRIKVIAELGDEELLDQIIKQNLRPGG